MDKEQKAYDMIIRKIK